MTCKTTLIALFMLFSFYSIGQTFQTNLQNAVTTSWQASGLPGVSVSVSTPDIGMVYASAGIGNIYTNSTIIPATTKYRIASATKNFTAVLLMRLQEAGYFNIDDLLSQHLVVPGLANGSTMTIRQIMNHSAGIGDYLNNSKDFTNAAVPGKIFTDADIVGYINGIRAGFAPGTSYEYSNGGFYILGMLIEKKLNTTIDLAMRDWVFNPLGLTNTFLDLTSSSSNKIPDLAEGSRAYNYSPTSVKTAGAIVSTTGDLAKFCKAVYGGTYLTQASINELIAPSLRNSAYGLGTRLYTSSNNSKYHGHTGTILGYNSFMYYIPSMNISVGINTNEYASVSSKWEDIKTAVFNTIEQQYLNYCLTNNCGGTAVAPTANFTPVTTTICAGQTVAFTSTSTGSPTTYNWTFAGGSPATSTSANPVVTFSNSGSYSVSLSVANSAGSNSKTVNSAVVVNSAGAAAIANFITPYAEVAVGDIMTLNNVSTGATTYNWSFPNGSPATSTEMNPTVSFTTTGSKTITLIASNACSSSTYTFAVCVGTNTKTTLETFESSVGRFNSSPTSSTSTIGIATTSTLVRATDSFKNGVASLKAVLNDNTAVATNWFVRLLSGSGTPSKNTKFTGNQGAFGFWMKTSSANVGAKVTAWIDDIDGTEQLPELDIINNGSWNYYEWFLPTSIGTAVVSGNGVVNGALVSLDAIVIMNNNTATPMTVWIDDIQHNYISGCTGTRKVKTIVPKEIVTPEKFQVTIYPNPTQGMVVIESKKDSETVVTVFNSIGQKMIEKTAKGTDIQIDLQSFNKGIYIFQILCNGTTTTKKIILE